MTNPDDNLNNDGNTTNGGDGNQMVSTGEICKIVIKPPVFSKRDPDLYFIQMESQFRNAGFSQDQSKYDYVVGSLDSATLANVGPRYLYTNCTFCTPI